MNLVRPLCLLLSAALVRQFGLSDPALGLESELVARIRASDAPSLPPAVQADLPDWLWERLVAQQGADEAMAIARGLLSPAPLDLRVNLARLSRNEALERLALPAAATGLSPAGIRLKDKPAIVIAAFGTSTAPCRRRQPVPAADCPPASRRMPLKKRPP